MEKEQIQKKNENIRRAILVSQLQEHPGFQVFMDDLNEVVKGYQFQDIRGVKELKDLFLSHGYVQAVEDLKYYFSNQKNYALLPMTDEETGEEEILNNKE